MAAPYKFLRVQLPDGSEPEDVFAISNARFQDVNAWIPVVCTSHPERIAVSWWNTARGRWSSWVERKHARIAAPRMSPADAAGMSWSRNVAVTADSKGLFIVYKRLLPQSRSVLHVERLLWDQDAKTFLPGRQRPLGVPLDQLGLSRPGLQVWAEWSNALNALLLVFQASITGQTNSEHLVLLRADLADPHIDLELHNSWTVSHLQRGGYDFDVLVENGVLHCVHRGTPHSVEFDLGNLSANELANRNVSRVVTFDTNDGYHATPIPLNFVSMNLNSGAVFAQDALVPGGDHPKIQSVKPLRITTGRIARGTITVRRLGALAGRGAYQGSSTVLAEFKPSGYSKILAVKTLDGWASAEIYTHDARAMPRFVGRLGHEHSQLLLDYPTRADVLAGRQMRLRAAMLHPVSPDYLLSVVPDPQRKRHFLDFVYHDSSVGALIARRFGITEAPPRLLIETSGPVIMDVNHEQLRNPYLLDADSAAETWHIQPFSGGGSLVEIEPGFHAILPRYDYDNTIGGALVFRKDVKGIFATYVDLADLGTRVVYPDLPWPSTDFPWGKKATALPQSTGSPTNSAEWLSFTSDTEWISMQFLQSPRLLILSGPCTIISATELPILTMLARLGRSPEVDQTVRLDENAILEAQRVLADHAESGRYSTPEGSDPRIILRVSPEKPLVGDIVTLDASETTSSSPIETVAWSTVSGVTLVTTHEFFAPGPHRISLRVAGGGRENTLDIELTVEASLWSRIWDFHEQLNTSIATVGRVKFSLPTLDISFRPRGAAATANREVIETPPEIGIVLVRNPRAEFALRQGGAQGYIDYRFLLAMETDDVDVHGLYAMIFGIRSIRAEVAYERAFTPAVTMAEQLSTNPLLVSGDIAENPTDLLEVRNTWRESVFTALPRGRTRLSQSSVKVRLSRFSVVFTTLLSVLLLLGLGTLALWIAGELAQIATIASTLGGGVAAAALLIALIIFIRQIVPPLIEQKIEERIRQEITSDRVKEGLDKARLMDYAGQGLAEEIAQRLLGTPIELQLDDGAQGNVRFARQAIEMIVVRASKCEALVRK